jgi:DNA-binding ferritin-like protein
MAKEISAVHQHHLLSLAMTDPHSMGVHKALQEVYPALADKLFEGNELMQKMVMSGFNMMDIMDYPICGKCESLALYNGYVNVGKKAYPRCTCIRKGCGASTTRPATLRMWLQYELKKKMPQEAIEDLETKVDLIAERMLRMHKQSLQKAYAMHNAIANQKMKVSKLDKGQQSDTPVVRHDKTSKLPENTVWIPDNIKGEEEDV